MCVTVRAGAKAWRKLRKSEMFRCVASLLGQRSTLRNLFLFCCYLSAVSCLFPLAVEFVLTNLAEEQEDRFCASDLVDHSDDLVVAFKWLWSSHTAISRFLGARKSTGATDLCWKNMWCPEREQNFSCCRYQHRMKLNWNAQAFLATLVRFAGILTMLH